MLDQTKDWTGDDVRRLCDQHGIGQVDLARLLRVREATVSDWIRGKAAPSNLASVALTYIEKDLARELVIRSRRLR